MDNKKKMDFVRSFDNLFKGHQDAIVDEAELIPESERVGYMDPSSVSMIIPKTKGFKVLFVSCFEVSESKIPTMDYSLDETDMNGGACSAKYSGEYLKVVFSLCKHYDSMVFTMKKDYPLRVETPDFIFILAPKVDSI